MQTINLIDRKGCKVIEFPDGELHLELDGIDRKEEVWIECRICNGNDLFLLMQLSDILKRQCVKVCQIDIYYLMGMRCDRLFDLNRPFTLGIVADVINSFNAKKVIVCEAHSKRTVEEIRNCVSLSQMYENIIGKDCLFVAPDKGARERYTRLKFSVVCSKKRDAATGDLLGFEAEALENVEGKDLMVVDDLCDGGGTFVGRAP